MVNGPTFPCLINSISKIGFYKFKIMKIIIAFLSPLFVLFSTHAEKILFNGESLVGWEGDPKFWRVEKGAIVGQTTVDNPTRGNTFIIWKGGELSDFVITLRYKIESGNSGIQYRSFIKPGEHDGWRISGYQADLEAGDKFSGICYGEGFRGILSMRGDKTTILGLNEKGKPEKRIEKFGDSVKLGEVVKKEKWNTYRISAKGNHFKHFINGVKMSELVDNDEKTRRMSGLLALQLHAGPPMKVHFKDIVLK